ncbi:TrbG/VirB9 family P-type conjugative transfer protein [Kiloniella laminariae]|uniref:TrbG/VirB9 family P-type conjugative transfer protein n=1 Tax=Kiloniella laminariae TaxID=454162 RepID=A0ABT4LPL9_9PROT|nr:TrbG/VirB9 family P-type conjugative transfer protein [Kiloniella laminariae]MCZ4283085.1 TrbG/VirB9 family P-type conjugative transfer protein [Kiloniella laminariae]
MKYSIVTVLTGGLIALAAVPGQAQEAAQCKTLLVQQGERHEIVSHGSVGTRIRFPANIETAISSLPDTAWNFENKGPNLWLRPKFDGDLAKETSQIGATVVLETGEEYDFIINTTPDTDISCYFVVDEQTALANLRLEKERREVASLRYGLNERMRELDEREAYMQDEYAISLAEAKRQIESQANDAIEAFKYQVNTAYTWNPVEGQPSHTKISSVYDDGTFTYIRVSGIGFGLPIITARSGEKDYTVQYRFNDLTGVFQLNGLFDRLHVKIDESAIEIGRNG